MESSSENQNQKVQNEGEVIFTSKIKVKDEMKGIEKNPSLQIEFCKIPKLNEKIYKLKKQIIEQILEQLHFHKSLFPIVAFLAHWILVIFGSQITIERIFYLVGILTNLKRCHLQSNNLDKLIFVSKNWPNGPRVSCSSHINLIMLVEFHGLRGIIRGVWGEFERNEILYLCFYLDRLFDWSCCIMLFKRLGYLIDIMLWDIRILKFDISYLLKIDILIEYV